MEIKMNLRLVMNRMLIPVAGLVIVLAPRLVFGADDTLEQLRSDTDTLWTCIAAFLVFFMQAGFAMVEAGFTRAKNAVNILMKNLMDFSSGAIVFWAVGFGLMFGASGGLFGTTDFCISGIGENGSVDTWSMAFLLFQTVFAATAATIVSGAMAERTKFKSYLIYTAVITGFVYPVFGSWAWGSLYHGSGWLENLGFIDFAGSTVVHSVGGWAALAGAIILGPRKGKYSKDGRILIIPGHNIPLAALGVFILWLGWFGFNPGSTTAVGNGDFATIAVTTNLAAAAGAIGAMILSWIKFGKADVGMSLNGALAGLVSITAPCANVSPFGAILIGLLGGFLVVLSVLFFDKIKVDDPVGAISVHGVCGAWGTLAAGLFACEEFGGVAGLFYGGGFGPVFVQIVGILACFIWTFGVAFILFKLINSIFGLRASEEDEVNGLDFTEHGAAAYTMS